ncbi:MAG: hypothetical protein ACD_73C00708G0002 [uncultured bacterium]|nr:MAG: hypothetical protein ACD_73C00708G0002 [uncultured bacterium]
MHHKVILTLILISCFIFLSSQVFSNDSMAEVKAGGLVLKQTKDIRMVKEDLYLSLTEIRVSSIFINDSDNDISTTIAFPVPNIPLSPEGDINIDLTSENPLSFSVTANDQPVVIKTEKMNTTEHVQLTYYWNQVFPAKKSVTIRHQYKPAYGQSPLAMFDPSQPQKSPIFENPQITQYCMDAGFLKSSQKLVADAAKNEKYPQSFTMGYILTSGANWKGPIGEFNLIIEKKKQTDLVSLCINGIKKTGPTRFEVHQKDFLPKKDIQLLFLSDSYM